MGKLLSAEDFSFWDKNGYVVIPDVVPPQNLQAVIDEIWDFLGMSPDEPDDWYREPATKGGMVEMYQTQGLWNNRQHPKVHQAFSEIWGTQKLWVSMDRANFKPPQREDKPDWKHEGMIHWDLDTSKRPIAFGVQGVLYLEDTREDQGTFQCVPGFHRYFEEWVRSQPEDRNPSHPDLEGLDISKIAGKAGDLLIWHRLLAHGNSVNRSDRPRLAQYITMSPANDVDEKARKDRVHLWKERLSPKGFPGDERRWEENNPPAELTDLGRRLVGLDTWSGQPEEVD